MTLMVGRTFLQFPEKIQIYHTHVTSALSHVQIARHMNMPLASAYAPVAKQPFIMI